jgi:hypothetical protein
MPRLFKTICACVFLFLFLVINTVLIPEPASAFISELGATSVDPYRSNFYILYNDLDGDGKFSLDELLGFSGIYITTYWGTHYYYDLLYAPDGRAASPYTDDYGGNWWFRYYGSYGESIEYWGWPEMFTYVNSVVAVPLPPTVFLLGSGLLGLAGWRRFRKG